MGKGTLFLGMLTVLTRLLRHRKAQMHCDIKACCQNLKAGVWTNMQSPERKMQEDKRRKQGQRLIPMSCSSYSR